ncbi:MAG: peptidyl-prolyl cis-trans isomerase [Pyrinomonadaceae bacterium]
MLKFFTRLEKTRNFVLLLFGLLMVASLVFFYAPTRNNMALNLARSEETAAKVAGEKITVGEIVRQRESYSQFSRGQAFPARMMLNGLITSRITRVEAERLGLTATDAEVAAALREQLKNPDGTTVDRARYEQYAVEQAGSVAAYEQNLRDNLSAQKLEAFLTAGVSVSEEELLNDFKKKNTKFDLAYVVVNPSDLAAKITPTEDELRQYYENNKNSYYISVPQKKIKYIFVNTTKIGEKLPLSDADLRAEYDKLPEEKRKAGVLGQEIVVRIPKPEMEGQALEKANEIIGKLKGDGSSPTVSEEKFAEVAKGFSENPISAPAGGKLRGPVKENPSKPDDPYQRLLKMKPGEITEPISYQGRYFILRRGEDVPKTFEDAKKEIEVSLRNRRAYSVAAELAGKIAEALKQNKDIQAVAQQFAPQANMSTAEMIRETGYIKPGDDVPNIGISPQFEEGIASLENPQDVGDKIPVKDGFAIPMVVDKKEPRNQEFDEVRAQVVEAVKIEKANAQLKEIADQIAAGASTADALAAAAAAKGLKAEDVKAFTIGSPLGQGPSASTNEELENALLGMKPGDVTKQPIMVGDNWFVVAVKNREEPSNDEFAKQRDSLMEQMLQQKRTRVFTDYLAATRRKYEDEGKIVIYPDAIAKIDEPSDLTTESVPQ